MGKDFYFHINPLLHDAFPYTYLQQKNVCFMFMQCLYCFSRYGRNGNVFRCLWKMSHKQGLVIMQNKMYFKLNCVCLPKDKRKKFIIFSECIFFYK